MIVSDCPETGATTWTTEMGRIADQLTVLIQRMEESDRRLKRLIDNHVESTSQHLEELKRLNKE